MEDGVGNLIGGVFHQWSCAHSDIGLWQEVARKSLPLSSLSQRLCGVREVHLNAGDIIQH